MTPDLSSQPRTPSDWTRLLARYRTPILSRGLFELAVTVIPFLTLFALSWAALSVSPWLALLLSIVNAAFLMRLFLIQHDCGHGSYFKSRPLNDWVGRAIGVLTLTPYDVWRRTHAIHHASTGNLDRRGVGDIPTLTIAEYRAKGRAGRALYHLVRNPLFLFGIVPFYAFFLRSRIPAGLLRAGWRYWLSALATDATLLALIVALYLSGGWPLLLFVYLPTTLLAASAGMWLFYVQHQFEETSWDHEADWAVQNAAMHGSSYYVLPPVLAWLTANIGVHHVHHMASRIPFYRLGEVLTDHEVLSRVQRVTLRESLHCARLHLWDEKGRRLVSFAEARAIAS
jgi:omega-6 fatty acid desaturase (delta-12 desaturase)